VATRLAATGVLYAWGAGRLGLGELHLLGRGRVGDGGSVTAGSAVLPVFAFGAVLAVVTSPAGPAA
jgi:hypothetical protein